MRFLQDGVQCCSFRGDGAGDGQEQRVGIAIDLVQGLVADAAVAAHVVAAGEEAQVACRQHHVEDHVQAFARAAVGHAVGDVEVAHVQADEGQAQG